MFSIISPLPDYIKIKVTRFEPNAWFDDEIVNGYINLCRKQESEYIASTLVYSQLASHYDGKKNLVSVQCSLLMRDV